MVFFEKPYTLRRYGKKTWAGGLPESPYTDSEIKLDLQPEGDGLVRIDEGHWVTRTMKAYSDVPLKTADPNASTDADRILYNHFWYECKSCSYWNYAVLAHYECLFEAVETESGCVP